MNSLVSKIMHNWKTSSTGLLMVLGGLTSIIYSVLDNGRVEQGELMIQAGAIITGLGLVFSRDVGVSTEMEAGRPDLEDEGERAGRV
jgi:hypothetical protein